LQGWDAGLSLLDRMTRRWRVSPPTMGYPNLVISDYFLANGRTGVDVIDAARRVRRSDPAFLISGDTTTERMRDPNAYGLRCCISL